jgi:addiction module HigA family antidote
VRPDEPGIGHTFHSLRPAMNQHSPFKAIDERIDIAPPHPGEILREDLLPHYNVTVTELAQHIGVSPQTLDTVLSERAPVTRALAKRLGRTLGYGAQYWMAVQLQYDLWHGSLAASHQAR